MNQLPGKEGQGEIGFKFVCVCHTVVMLKWLIRNWNTFTIVLVFCRLSTFTKFWQVQS